MTSDIVSVEIGRSTWQGPAEEAPWRADNRDADMAECAAFSAGYEAGERDGRASGQQVRALWPRWREMLLDESPIPGAAIKEMDEAFAALTPAPQAATPTEQAAMPVAWQVGYHSKWVMAPSCWTDEDRANWPGEHRPLFAHPPQPTETVAVALSGLMEAYKEIADSGDAGFWKAEETPEYQAAVAALRALKGGAHG
ncbi:hypothetical protein VB636_20770 [Paracoccus sp. APAP_BH8]|uniref:hypothetical protein n=1 Tax=Paracoccus sp. APAP_BH8 TaxID=3110237 RepID=UPI002FD83401